MLIDASFLSFIVFFFVTSLFYCLYKYLISRSSCFHLLSSYPRYIFFCLVFYTFWYFSWLCAWLISMSNKSVSTSIFFLALVVLHGFQNTEERHLKTTSLETERIYKKDEVENRSIVATNTRHSVLRKAVITHPTDFRPTNPGNSPGVGHSNGRHWFDHIIRQNLYHI